MRRYFRPNGQSRSGKLIIPDAYRPERVLRLEVIENEGIEFTLEVFDHGVNICMDDGTFDYKFEFVTSDQVNETVLRLIDGFDVHHYRNAYQIMSRG